MTTAESARHCIRMPPAQMIADHVHYCFCRAAFCCLAVICSDEATEVFLRLNDSQIELMQREASGETVAPNINS